MRRDASNGVWSSSKKIILSLLSTCLSLGLAACGSSGFGGIRGPSAVLLSSDVISASGNTKLIIDALARDNNIPIDGFYTSPLYYDVAVAGFNFIDDQCATYFDKLFYLQRDRQFAQDVLQAGSQATAAVLTITRASEITFGVVAAAFGFSSSLTNSVAGSFLFQLPPATTYGFVKELQTAYRSGVNPASITSPSAAYHLMQDYLAICLPPNIEARLVERVANTRAIPQSPTRSNPSPDVIVADRFAPQVTQPRTAAPVTRQAGPQRTSAAVTIKPTRQAPAEAAGWKDVSPSVTIDVPTAQAIQRSLCLPESPHGSFNAETELGLKIYLAVANNKSADQNWRSQPVTLTQADVGLLRNVNRCSTGAENYLESWLLSSKEPGAPKLGDDISAAIRDKFKITDKNASFQNLRSEIAKWRKELGLDSGPDEMFKHQITPDFVMKVAPIQD